jgi:hypothetical protein
MDIIGAKHPFFKPARRRYITVGVTAAWACFEWIIGDPFWSILATGLTGLAAWQLILNYKPETTDGDSDAKP